MTPTYLLNAQLHIFNVKKNLLYTISFAQLGIQGAYRERSRKAWSLDQNKQTFLGVMFVLS